MSCYLISLKFFISLYINLSFVVVPSFSARILGIVPTPSYSHQIAFRPLWKELSLRGHQLTVMTANPMKDPSLKNLTEIDFNFSYETWDKRVNLIELAEVNVVQLLNVAIRVGYEFVEEQFQHPDTQKLLENNSESFDLVLVEPLFPAMAAFAEKFNCPLIQILSLDGMSYMYHAIGNPSHPILNPDFLMAFSENSNFFQRLTSTFTTVFMNLYYYPAVLEAHQELIHRYFGENFPHLKDIIQRTSMMFVNTNIIFHTLRPLMPNVIQFGGGTHLTAANPLPEKLKTLLDAATDGFIYFSLGTNVKSTLLPEDLQKNILETLADLPYTILWKFENEELPGVPHNVYISKWFPQQNIFNHPNIKLFITQGGLQSLDEAIYHHIPLIGMPFSADQLSNVQRVISKGMGLHVDFNTLEKESFKKTILEVINNPKYRNRVKELADLARDQSQTGLERVIWWTEYVIRHKGAKHLRSPALDLPFYQYFLLDVIGFCVLILVILCYVVYKLVKLIYRLVKYFVSKNKAKTQ